MTSGLLVLALCLGQADPPPPPPSPPPLLSAEGEGVVQPPPAPLQESLTQPTPGYLPPVVAPIEPREPEVEAAPGTPTVWWKRSLATVGMGAGFGLGVGTLVAVISWQAICSGGVCAGTDLFGIFAVSALAATFTIPAGISLLGRALGGRAKYGHALLGTGLFGAAGLIVAIAITGGSDVPVVVIPVFASLMVLGGVASFELFSFLNEPKVQVQPVIGMVKGGGMLGLQGSF